MSQPNALHQSMLRAHHLMIGQHRLVGVVVLVVCALLGIVMLTQAFDLSILGEIGPEKPITSLHFKLLSAVILILVLIVSSGISIANRRPTRFRVQTYALWPRILLNLLGALLFLLVSLTLLAMVYEYYLDERLMAPNTEEHLKANRKVKVIAILLTLVIVVIGGLILRWLGRVGLRNLFIYWQQVRLTGYFDKEDYKLGDQMEFMLKDRQSLDGTRRYRVHLNFVTEEMEGSTESKQIVRKIRQSSFQDCTAGELHLGIKFTLPETENSKWQYTNLSSRRLPQYWELFLEGEESSFFARFFVNVTKPLRIP
jgi:hypothetical protein